MHPEALMVIDWPDVHLFPKRQDGVLEIALGLVVFFSVPRRARPIRNIAQRLFGAYGMVYGLMNLTKVF